MRRCYSQGQLPFDPKVGCGSVEAAKSQGDLDAAMTSLWMTWMRPQSVERMLQMYQALVICMHTDRQLWLSA